MKKHIHSARSMRYSVDEVFFDISLLQRINIDLNQHVKTLRQAIYKETGVQQGLVSAKTPLSQSLLLGYKNCQSYQG
ncbi:hypothetical protein [Photobacterium piscicola]|uniref:hypothetical protein n=1 Tax=Photobacterium piscicola TaxID=1378299 RepID=UPI0038CF7822